MAVAMQYIDGHRQVIPELPPSPPLSIPSRLDSVAGWGCFPRCCKTDRRRVRICRRRELLQVRVNPSVPRHFSPEPLSPRAPSSSSLSIGPQHRIPFALVLWHGLGPPVLLLPPLLLCRPLMPLLTPGGTRPLPLFRLETITVQLGPRECVVPKVRGLLVNTRPLPPGPPLLSPIPCSLPPALRPPPPSIPVFIPSRQPRPLVLASPITSSPMRSGAPSR